jgi:hypothetical protein
VTSKTLSFVRGKTYALTITASGHPFWIKTSQTPGSTDAVSSGIFGNGAQSGQILYTVPSTAPDTLYYVCEYHFSMTGVIIVSSGM